MLLTNCPSKLLLIRLVSIRGNKNLNQFYSLIIQPCEHQTKSGLRLPSIRRRNSYQLYQTTYQLVLFENLFPRKIYRNINITRRHNLHNPGSHIFSTVSGVCVDVLISEKKLCYSVIRQMEIYAEIIKFHFRLNHIKNEYLTTPNGSTSWKNICQNFF